MKKFGKKQGQLTISEPTPENRTTTDLSDFYKRYERLLQKLEELTAPPSPVCCALGGSKPCDRSFKLELIEALYLNDRINITLSAEQRKKVIQQANEPEGNPEQEGEETSTPETVVANCKAIHHCPLRQDDNCLLYQSRPLHCRLKGFSLEPQDMAEINKELALLSAEVFQVIFDELPGQPPPAVSFADSVSGKFIQRYFQYLTNHKKSR